MSNSTHMASPEYSTYMLLCAPFSQRGLSVQGAEAGHTPVAQESLTASHQQGKHPSYDQGCHTDNVCGQGEPQDRVFEQVS